MIDRDAHMYASDVLRMFFEKNLALRDRDANGNVPLGCSCFFPLDIKCAPVTEVLVFNIYPLLLIFHFNHSQREITMMTLVTISLTKNFILNTRKLMQSSFFVVSTINYIN